MSRFREQLQQARLDYESARYPGDLAQEMLGRRIAPGPRRWIWWAAAGSIAAALAVVLLVRFGWNNPSTPLAPEPSSVAKVDKESAPDFRVPAIPELPEAVAMLPQVDNTTMMLPSGMPTMPSFSWFATYEDTEESELTSSEEE